jgi:oxygen-independent coproporphyrinogen-3 oxidase
MEYALTKSKDLNPPGMNTYGKQGEGWHPLGIYVQVPFCQTKCTYCNFHTGVAARAAYAPYARIVEREIRNWKALHAAVGLKSADDLGLGDIVFSQCCHSGLSDGSDAAIVDTVYLGGGTPSLFEPADLVRILDAVRSQFSCASDPEITLEADPETITREKAAAWLAAGINRISLGVQSFHDAELKAAGRMHRRADIFSAIECLRSIGFANISLDLIAGLPHQTEASWRESVEEAIRLRPEHISIYLFEIDEGSRLGKEILSGGSRYSASAVPSEDAMAESYEFACERLARAGYEHYEISNWALPGFRSRHNLKYWRREPYLGFGAGAHSFDGRSRWANAHDPAAYVAAIEAGRLPIEQLEEVTPKQALDEELFLGLRQLEGIDLAEIEARYAGERARSGGAALERREAQYNGSLGERIEDLCAQGLLEREGSRVRLAPARLTVSNEVFVALLDAGNP